MIRKMLRRLFGREIAGGSKATDMKPTIDDASQWAVEVHDYAWSDYEGTPI